MIWFVAFKSFAQPRVFTTQYMLGSKTLSFVEKCYNACNHKTVFINVHDNEQTSRLAADSFLQTHGGLLVYLVNDSLRNITFETRRDSFIIDPNRMFSAAGRVASLKLLSPNKRAEAAPQVSYIARAFLMNYVNDKPLVIALHNNSDTNFSIKTYLYIKDSIPKSYRVSVNDSLDEDDFILTNNLAIYKAVKAKNLNVVYENAKAIVDDGSLSVYTAIRRIPYLNIEAEHGHVFQQYQMLKAIEDIISRYERSK